MKLVILIQQKKGRAEEHSKVLNIFLDKWDEKTKGLK